MGIEVGLPSPKIYFPISHRVTGVGKCTQLHRTSKPKPTGIGKCTQVNRTSKPIFLTSSTFVLNSPLNRQRGPTQIGSTAMSLAIENSGVKPKHQSSERRFFEKSKVEKGVQFFGKTEVKKMEVCISRQTTQIHFLEKDYMWRPLI